MRRLASAALAVVACSGSPTESGSGCPGVGGFGAIGCSRIAVTMVLPSPPLPTSYALDLLVRDPNSGGAMASATATSNGATPLTVWFHETIPGDTIRAWVVGRMFDLTDPQSPVVASDSVRFLFHISRNGTLPAAEPVTLTLAR